MIHKPLAPYQTFFYLGPCCNYLSIKWSLVVEKQVVSSSYDMLMYSISKELTRKYYDRSAHAHD